MLEQGYNKRKDQRDFDYFNNMGYSLSQIEEYEDSISHLKRAQELKNGPSVKTCLAEVYLKQRNFTQAGEMILSALDDIKKIGPNSFNRYANIFLLISEINSALKQDQETIDLFNQILKNKFNENIFFLLANINPKLINKKIIEKAEENLLEMKIATKIN